MNWRVAVNGAVLVVAVSAGAANASVGESSSRFIDSESGSRRLLSEDARTVLSSIKVENEYRSGYRRSFFVHWSDLDGNGCDAREDVLKRDSISKPQVDPYRCYVVAGDWYSPYDGSKLSDRTDVDIDHVVALKEAWDSGAWAWSDSQRKAYANDLTDGRTLIAVRDRVNVSKGDKDPSNWMPPLRSYWCTYLGNWISIKARWDLSMDRSEFGRINNVLDRDCAGLSIASWSPAPVTTTLSTSTTTTTTAPTTTTVPTVTIAPTVTTTTTATTATTTTTTTTTTTVTTTTTAATKDIYPGSFCSPVDALGSYRGTSYVCSKTNAAGTPYAGGRARWRKSTN